MEASAVTHASHWRYKEEQYYPAPKKVPINVWTHPNLWTELTCLQCVFCCVFVGDISFGIKAEAVSYAMPECPHDDMPSTGMIVIHHEYILCTTFALMFMSFCYMRQNK